ncbi:MAG: hypothetical protein J2P21_20160 [Chloracidobacterium sp.]|nr:hypothetical protein [Chloracidobacterium sp.]
MALKPIFILLMGIVLGCADPQVGQQPPSQSPGQLPEMLSEVEKQAILRERDPKPHVESALRIADARIKNAVQLSQESRTSASEQDMDAFLALIVYADTYTRKTLASKSKDRNQCLKRIEQAIFKQSRNLDSIASALPLESRDAAEAHIGEVKKIRLRAINDLLGQGQVINSPN